MQADRRSAPPASTATTRPLPIDTLEYRRVSTTGQAADDKSSLTDQGKANAALAAKLGRHIGLAFEDPGVSGGTADRPGFQRMISYCETHPRRKLDWGYVLVLNASRFGRFEPDLHGYWRQRLKKAGWLVRFAEADDIEHPTGRAVMRAINAAQAQEYRENLSANSKRGKRGTAERGYWVTKAPYGYRRRVVVPPERARTLESGIPKANDERVKLTIGPDREARIIRWMFAAYDSGRHSITSLTRHVQRLGTSLGWSRSFVHHVLANPVYAGDIVGGRIRHDREADDFAWRRDESEWYTTLDAHPALVSRELFERVQKRLSARQGQTTSPGTAYVLSGLVTCSTCGEPYVGGGGGRNPRNPAEVRRFYKDRGGNEPKQCAGRLGTISRHILEDAVVSAIADEVARPEVQSVIAEELDRLIEAADSTQEDTTRELEAERLGLERKRTNLVEAVADGTMTKEEASPALSRLRNELAAVREHSDQSRFTGRTRNRLREERDRILALASTFAERVHGLSGFAQRELVAPWIEQASFDKVSRALSLTLRLVPLPDAVHLSNSQGRGSP